MADSPALQQARENVAKLEREEALDKDIAELEKKLASMKEERQNLGKPPAPAQPGLKA